VFVLTSAKAKCYEPAMISAEAAAGISQHMTVLFILIGILAGLKIVVDKWTFDKRREKRRTYYRTDHIRGWCAKSE
jgi:hypothetical protein